jgi:hypothetical protein
MDTTDDASIVLSPLLNTFLAGLKVELTTKSTEAERIPLIDFIRKIVFGFISQAATVTIPQSIVQRLSAILRDVGNDETDEVAELIDDCIRALVEVVDNESAGVDPDLLESVKAMSTERSFLSSVSPLGANVFATTSADRELLEK